MRHMNKTYAGIIGFLFTLALLVGGYAIWKTTNQPVPPPVPVAPAASPLPPAKTNLTPAPGGMLSSEILLTVNSPKDGTTVTTSKVAVQGQTVAGADVSVNNRDIVADSQGNFSITISLDEGDNPIDIVASDQLGNYSEWEGIVTYEPAQ